MRIILMTVFVWIAFATHAMAATVDIHTYENGRVFIGYDGETEDGDLERVKEAFAKAMQTGKFSGDIHMRGPGGLAKEGEMIAEYIRDMGFTTVARDYCVSACSLMWLSGTKRFIEGDSRVGFHFAYTDDVDFLENELKLSGWKGIQDGISKHTHYFTGLLFKYGIAQPYEFLMGLSRDGKIDGAFWITKDNINIVGGETY